MNLAVAEKSVSVEVEDSLPTIDPPNSVKDFSKASARPRT